MTASSFRTALTAHQERVYRYLQAQHETSGVMPSVREIQRHFQFASQNQAVSVLRALEKKGAVQRLPKKARGLLLTNRQEPPATQAIPVLGTIPAGFPVEEAENLLGHLHIDARLFGSTPVAMIFGLLVRGDSMVDAGIHDGDYAFCQSTESRVPHPHDIVAAVIDGESTLKRYFVLEGMPCLKAENSRYPDLIPARELRIQGVYLGLLRGINAMLVGSTMPGA